MTSLTGRLARRVRNESRDGMRRKRLGVGRDRYPVPDDAPRDQVGAGIVIERNRLGRRARRAVELHVVGMRSLVPAMPRADLASRPILGLGRGLADRRGWWRLPFAEQGNADDADVIRTAGARSIGVWKRSEIERRRLAEVAPPALDVKPATRRKHVAALLRVGALPGDHIDAIDR